MYHTTKTFHDFIYFRNTFIVSIIVEVDEIIAALYYEDEIYSSEY